MNKILLTLAVAVSVCLTACAQKKEKTSMEATKTLVVYFSATGTTEKVAQSIAEVTGGELFEIVPQASYTRADLDWTDKQSRSSVEMADAGSRPAMKSLKDGMDAYDVVFIGFPIWWDLAPRIVNTFIESHDLKGKTLVPFATSGGSGIGNSVSALKKAYPDLNWEKGKLLNRASRTSLQEWMEQDGLLGK